jgi:hypothetical protein
MTIAVELALRVRMQPVFYDRLIWTWWMGGFL